MDHMQARIVSTLKDKAEKWDRGGCDNRREEGKAPEGPAEDHEMDLSIWQWHVLIGIGMVQKQMLDRITRPGIWKHTHFPLSDNLSSHKFCGIRSYYLAELTWKDANKSHLPLLNV